MQLCAIPLHIPSGIHRNDSSVTPTIFVHRFPSCFLLQQHSFLSRQHLHHLFHSLCSVTPPSQDSVAITKTRAFCVAFPPPASAETMAASHTALWGAEQHFKHDCVFWTRTKCGETLRVTVKLIVPVPKDQVQKI